MSLQFILGNAGSGKSTYLYDHVIAEAGAHPKENFLVIVPEQFTMHTQRQLVDMHPNHAIMNIDVLSFDRLAYRIFDELGTDTLEVLEETGKNLLLRKVAQEEEVSLTTLGKNIKRPGYITQVKSLLSEFRQYDISPDQLYEIMENKDLSPSLQDKGKDLAHMYEAFSKKIEDTYITTEQILQLFLQVADDSKILNGATIVFDGFTGFTPIQNQVIDKLLSLAKKVLVTFTCDHREDIFGKVEETELFAITKNAMQKLIFLAKRKNIEIVDPVILDGSKGRFAPDSRLEHLESNLFRQDSHSYDKSYECSDLELVSLKNPRMELAYAVSEIEKAVRSQKRSYSEFAIVCARLEDYRYLVPSVMKQYHVPFFLDAKAEIVFHPMTEFISALFDILQKGFSYETVMRYLRCGMTDFTPEEIDFFENYILATGIRGRKKYASVFEIRTKKYTPEILLELNELRTRFFDGILAFEKSVIAASKDNAAKYDHITKKAKFDVSAITVGLYEFLQYHEVYKKLSQMAEKYDEEGDSVKASQYRQIYGCGMDLLDKLVTILGEDSLTIKEYQEILMSGFEAISIGMIPPAKDCVFVGDMERTRLSDIKTMYLIGANDGAIPKSAGGGGIITPMDREKLLDLGVELAPSERQKAFLQRFYLYFVMTKPSEKLVVTCSRVDNKGASLRPSYLMGLLSSMFLDVEVTFLEELPDRNRILTQETAREYFAEKLKDYVEKGQVNDAFFACLSYYGKNQDPLKNQLLDAAFYQHKEGKISSLVVDALYGNEMHQSVSRMEKYSACAYAYFLEYGLKLREREELSFKEVDMGNIYHDALNRYAKNIEKLADADWHTISDEKSDEILADAIEKALQNMENPFVQEQKRSAYAIHRMKQTLKQTVDSLRAQIKKGKFVPKAFEVDFKEVGDLDALMYQIDDMHKVRLYGKIDRMDLYEKSDCCYVKIVDYKSGNRSVEFDKTYFGLQIQLVLYMDAAIEGLKKKNPEKNFLPGAMFYYHIDRPIVEKEKIDKDISDDSSPEYTEKKEELILRENKMRGFINENYDVFDALDCDLKPSYSSPVVPLGYSSKEGEDGNPALNQRDSKVLSADDFAMISQYVKNQVLEHCKEILEGNIDCKPYRMDKKDGCEFCKFSGVCGFDVRVDGFSYNEMQKLGNDKAIEKMREYLMDDEDADDAADTDIPVDADTPEQREER